LVEFVEARGSLMNAPARGLQAVLCACAASRATSSRRAARTRIRVSRMIGMEELSRPRARAAPDLARPGRSTRRSACRPVPLACSGTPAGIERCLLCAPPLEHLPAGSKGAVDVLVEVNAVEGRCPRQAGGSCQDVGQVVLAPELEGQRRRTRGTLEIWWRMAQPCGLVAMNVDPASSPDAGSGRCPGSTWRSGSEHPGHSRPVHAAISKSVMPQKIMGTRGKRACRP
jgi:hypothetical protein